MKTTLFVYGTLKQGCGNNQLLAGQDFLGPGLTLACYRLYDCGPYPGLVEDRQNGIAIRGELWRIDEELLPRLDELEGVPLLFVRGGVAIEGVSTIVEAYFYNRPVAGLRDCGSFWPSPEVKRIGQPY